MFSLMENENCLVLFDFVDLRILLHQLGNGPMMVTLPIHLKNDVSALTFRMISSEIFRIHIRPSSG